MARTILNLSLTPIILLAIAILILFSHISVSKGQVNIPTKPIEVDLFVDGLNLLRSEASLRKSLKSAGKTNLTIAP